MGKNDDEFKLDFQGFFWYQDNINESGVVITPGKGVNWGDSIVIDGTDFKFNELAQLMVNAANEYIKDKLEDKEEEKEIKKQERKPGYGFENLTD